MALFERPPLETLASAKDRWTPLYLEHGRPEVDESNAFRETFRRGIGSAKGFSFGLRVVGAVTGALTY